jgi:uncharacterized delta-60 repeat protein
MNSLGSLAVLLALGATTGLAQTPSACCSITAIDRATGLVSAKVAAGSQVFQFRVTNARTLPTLRVGQGVYANFTTRQVSLDGRSVCCAITSGPTAPAVASGPRPPAAAPGSLDADFGKGGKVISPIGASGDLGQAMTVQADGKIVVAGYCHPGNSASDFCLARFSSAGVLDAGFGKGGKAITPVSAYNDYGRAVVVQTGGKIVIAGYCSDGASTNPHFDFCLARYHTVGPLPGALDASFGGGDGKVISPIGPSDDNGTAVAVQADGKIVVAGYCVGASNIDFCLARYSSAGVLDTGFGGGDGKVISPIGAYEDYAYAVAVQADGKIVVAGYCRVGTYTDFCLARYSPAGVLDAGFGSRIGTRGGKVISPIGAYGDFGYAVVVQADGKIVVAGNCNDGTDNYVFCLARYGSAGVLDAGFGTGGKVLSVLGASDRDYGYAVAVQADGKIVVAGHCYKDGGGIDFCLARYSSAGVLDASFGTGGKVITPIGALVGYVYAGAVAVQVDGKIVVAGYCSGVGNYDFCLARYHP